jgi:hypothetical protein
MVEALQIYLKAYRSLIVHESVDNSVILSFPLHLAANHRVEITVTTIDSDRYIVSDGGKTFGEMEAVGRSVTQTMMERFERLVSTDDVRIIQGHLLMETKVTELGFAIQTVLELCKTIGDVYLIHKLRDEADQEVIDEVASVLRTSHIHFQRDKKISGELEKHPFDIVVNPNGVPGMALKVLGGAKHAQHGSDMGVQMRGHQARSLEKIQEQTRSCVRRTKPLV